MNTPIHISRLIKLRTSRGLALLAGLLWLTAQPAVHATEPAKEPNATDAIANPTVAEQKSYESFWSRIGGAFRDQYSTPAFVPADPKAAPAPRRGQPAPFDGPPFPTAEWQIGGTPIIGDPNIIPPSPLMQAIYAGPNGRAIKDSRIQLYGWENFSGNLSTSTSRSIGANGQSANFPVIYDQRPNRLEQDQFVLYLERVPDEFQTDHIDWGFRLSALYGLTYRYTISRGFFSGQLLKHNHYYGYDFPMLYADIYIPYVAQGMNIRIGRIISEPDIEAQLAPNNLMASHSMLYSFDPYCQWGIFTTTKLDSMWTIQAGISAGNDVAPWQADQGRRLTGTVMVQWISKSNMDSIYAGVNAFNNGRFGYNNLQQYVATWTHKFNDKIWTITESWYMFQRHATSQATRQVPYQNGFFPVANGFTPEFAIVNYTLFRMGPNSYFTVRNEFFNDIRGNRTGYATKYTENSVGVTWWPNKSLTVRPELRFDHAYEATPYNNGTRRSQLVFGCDVIQHF